MMYFSRTLLNVAALLACYTSAYPLTKRATSAADPTIVDAGGNYMRATYLADGSIMGAYATGGGIDHHITATRSTDGGLTWSETGVVSSATAPDNDLDNADILQIGGGRILAAFRNHDKNSDGTYKYYRISVCHSEDNGATWEFLSQADERPAADNNGLWEPFMRMAGDGSVQIYYSSESEGEKADQDNIMKVSSDGGLTWGPVIQVSGSGITSRDGMTGVTSIDGGANLICVFENTEDGNFAVNYVLSHDDGLTWGERGRIYTPAAGKAAGSPQVALVGGTLVASFMTNEDGGSASDTAVDGGSMKTVGSTDGGITWSGATTVSPVGSHWGGVFATNDRTFLTMVAIDGTGLQAHSWNV